MKEVRIGLVGAGKIANDLHFPAYIKARENNDGVVLAAVCDIDIERAKAAAEKLGIEKYYASMDEMIADADIDAVDICTWNKAHVPLCIAAAKAGKHIMCEKPAAMTVEEMRELKAILEEKKLVYMLAVPGRFKTDAYALKERIDAGEFGEIYYAKTAYIRRRGEPTGWFTDREYSGGGPIIDIGVHAIDAAWYLMGEPKPVRVSAKAFYDKIKTEHVRTRVHAGAPSPNGDVHTTEDSGSGVIYFDNGAQLFFEASWTIHLPDFRETIFAGTKSGAFRANPNVIYSEKDGALTDEKLEIPAPNFGYDELMHFANCVKENNVNTIYNIDKAMQMQSILNAIYASSELGREVTIDEEGNIK